MDTREYTHEKCNPDSPDSNDHEDFGKDSTTTISEQILEYRGRRILTAQRQTKTGDGYTLFTIVPGYLTEERFRTNESGVAFSKVKIIPHQSRKNIETLVKKAGFKEPIIFW